jgi:hypothetical protein
MDRISINDASRSECLPKGDLQISSSQEGGINCRACSVRHRSASLDRRETENEGYINNEFILEYIDEETSNSLSG